MYLEQDTIGVTIIKINGLRDRERKGHKHINFNCLDLRHGMIGND
jgi:hypothetical protein